LIGKNYRAYCFFLPEFVDLGKASTGFQVCFLLWIRGDGMKCRLGFIV
jgi:hypothetical protein